MDPQSTATVPTTIGLITDRTRREEESEFVMQFVERSDDKRRPYHDVWEEVLDNYMVASPTSGSMQERVWPSGSKVPRGMGRRRDGGDTYLKDPETHQIVESLVAQALLLLFGQRDYITAVPVGPDDPEKARLVARLLMAQLEQPGVFRTHYQLFKNAFLFGTSIIEIGWEARSRAQLVKKAQIDPLTGTNFGDAITQEEVVYRDRPLQREVALWDFYPDPGGTRIHDDMIGVAKRFRITAWQAQKLAEAGVYDKQAVQRAISRSAGSRQDASPLFNPSDVQIDDKDMRLLTGFEYWGSSPVYYADGANNRVITILEGENVRSHINPFIDGAIPFKEIVVNPVGGRFYGLSPAEVIRYLQDSADNMLMVLNDAADLAVRSPLLVGGNFGGDPIQLRNRKLNDLIFCRDPKSVLPIPVDLNVLSLAAQDLMRRKLTMREATGATNPLQSIPAGDRTTATEINTLVQLASQRVELMVSLIERDDYPWIGRTIHSRNRQFLPPGGAVATLLGETFDIPYEAVDLELDVRFVGSRTAQTRAQKVLQYKDAIQTVAGGLQLLPIMPELFERYLRDGLEIPDAAQILTQAVLRSHLLGGEGGAETGEPQGSPPASSGEGQTPAETSGVAT